MTYDCAIYLNCFFIVVVCKKIEILILDITCGFRGIQKFWYWTKPGFSSSETSILDKTRFPETAIFPYWTKQSFQRFRHCWRKIVFFATLNFDIGQIWHHKIRDFGVGPCLNYQKLSGVSILNSLCSILCLILKRFPL